MKCLKEACILVPEYKAHQALSISLSIPRDISTYL